MKHIGQVTVGREVVSKDTGWTAPACADAKSDFLNGLWRLWGDYAYSKKNEMAIE